MNAQEWAAFALELDASFRGDFGPSSEDDARGAAQEAVYLRHFGGLPYDVAAAAVALLVNEGQVFLPAPGELATAVERIEQRTSAPFAEAWHVFQHAFRRLRGDHVAIVAAVAEQAGEGAARWVDSRGSQTLAHEPTEGDHAGAVRHRLEQEYSGFVAVAREDRRVGRALERAQSRELSKGASGPRRVDAAGALGLPRGDA